MFIYIADYLQQISGNADLKRVYTKHILKTRQNPISTCEVAVCSDHIHICVSIPPKLSVSEFVGYLKGKSALMIHYKHPEMTNKWSREFRARVYYVTTICNINDC